MPVSSCCAKTHSRPSTMLVTISPDGSGYTIPCCLITLRACGVSSSHIFSVASSIGAISSGSTGAPASPSMQQMPRQDWRSQQKCWLKMSRLTRVSCISSIVGVGLLGLWVLLLSGVVVFRLLCCLLRCLLCCLLRCLLRCLLCCLLYELYELLHVLSHLLVLWCCFVS